MSDSHSEILPISVADEMSKSFLDYSMSVIISRALPDARDGLKPSQRRILFAMHELSLYPPKKHMKCAKICGDTSGNYHPHGEAVIYPTLVNMGQHWSTRECLVDPQGNFGSVEGDPPAAMRYTEARLTHLGGALMEDMEKDTVDFVSNYDERLTEPTVFPAAFPNLLVNGGTGIAVGMATNIPPHNLGETVDALCAIIDNPALSTEELLEIMIGPDFPTGCTILGVSGIREYFATGRGSVKVRAEATIEDLPGNREQIIVTEIPYAVNRATLVERIAQLVNEKVLPEISAIRDESDENTRLVIELKREARAQVTLNRLYKLTALQTSFSINLLAIVERRPRLLTVRAALDVYLEHRREVILRRTRYLLGKAELRAEVLEAFLLALSRIDEFIEIIRSSKDRDEARGRLSGYRFEKSFAEGLGILIRNQPSIQGGSYVFTERQVNAILELRLYQLTGLEQGKIEAEYREILVTIEDLLDILAREERVLGIIKDELQALKAARATPRKTRIEASSDEIVIEDLIANEPMVVTISNRGYIKRTNAREYQAQRRGGSGVKGMETRRANQTEEDADFVERLFAAHAHDYLMFFTDTGRVYVERVYEVPETGRAARGRAIRNLLDLRPDEKIAAVLRVERQTDDNGADQTFAESRKENVFFATADGTVKKTRLAEFRNYNKNGIIAIKIDEGNSLISVRLTSGDDDIVLVTANGQAMRFQEDDVRAMGRPSRGVRGIRLKEGRGDAVVGMALVTETGQMLVASNQGLGKRTGFADYPRKNRGGQGVLTMKFSDADARVVRAVAIEPGQELVLITTGGQTVRIRSAEVRETGRSAQGVRLIRLRGGESLQDLTAVDPEEEVAEEIAEELAQDGIEELPDDAQTKTVPDAETDPETDSTDEEE